MKRITTLLLAACLATASYTQEVQKCCGTSNSTFLLGNLNYAAHTQCIYRASELTGAVDGNITRLYYRYGDTNEDLGNTLGTLKISLLQTSAISFTGTTFLTGLQSVLEVDSLTIPPGNTGDWFPIDLQTPFTYDAALSLVVDIRFETSAHPAFGTLSVGSTTGRKIMSSSTTSPVGETWSSLQDVGFDLDQGTGMVQTVRTSTLLFPNPANEQTSLYLAQALSSGATLTLTDLSGRMIMRQMLPMGSTQATVDLASVPAGLYLLVLRDASGLLDSRRLARQ